MDGHLVRGHTYTGAVARDNARVHYGDAYYNGHTNVNYYYSYLTPSQQSPRSLTSHDQRAESGAGELLSLKRKRASNEGPAKQDINGDESLEHVLSKLGKFSRSIQDQRIGKDAKKIVRRIALIVNAVKQQAAMPGEQAPVSMAASHDEDDFESIDNCLLVAKRVDINAGFHRMGRTKLVRVVRKRDVVTFEQWEICLSTASFESWDQNGTAFVESLASVCLNPRNPSAGSPVQVYFGERADCSATSFIYPIVSAYRIVPDSSEVFGLIQQDDLDGLEKLLASGKATLRDCDERNTGLLYVSQTSVFQLRID
jgi:hypothetical protein